MMSYSTVAKVLTLPTAYGELHEDEVDWQLISFTDMNRWSVTAYGPARKGGHHVRRAL